MMNLLNKTLIMAFPLFFVNNYAQVGIQTNAPNAMLDVNGDVLLRNELRTGGTDLVDGKPGGPDQVLVSQGEGSAPVWKSINVRFIENTQYKLINTYIKDDQIGLKSLTGNATNPKTSSVGENITNSTTWKKIPGLSTEIEIKVDKNKITYQVQAGVELVANTGESVGFVCGIFKNNILAAIRPDNLAAVNTDPIQGLYTLNYTETDSSTGKFTMDVACRVTSTSNIDNKLSIGVNTSDSNTGSNAFALKSFFKTDIAELVIFTNEN